MAAALPASGLISTTCAPDDLRTEISPSSCLAMASAAGPAVSPPRTCTSTTRSWPLAMSALREERMPPSM